MIIEAGHALPGVMRLELIHAEGTRGHGETAGTTGVSAGNVLRRIADDDHVFGSEVDALQVAQSLDGDGTEMIAIFSVVAKGTIIEVRINTEALKLQERTTAEVAREQSKVDVPMASQRVEQRLHGGQQATSEGVRAEPTLKVTKVGLTILVSTSLGHLGTRISEELAHNAAIRGTR